MTKKDLRHLRARPLALVKAASAYLTPLAKEQPWRLMRCVYDWNPGTEQYNVYGLQGEHLATCRPTKLDTVKRIAKKGYGSLQWRYGARPPVSFDLL